jgi:hypothetical protein
VSPVDKSNYIEPLLGAIAHAASERDTRLTKLRLVKFIYLFDLFWAQAEKRTFTNWPWAFVHYGPYCRESTDAIDRAEKLGYLTAESYESNYSNEDFRLYGPGNRITEAEVDKVKNLMPLYVSSRLFSVVKKWGDDTYGLLDYVYFHTGPMMNPRPGEPLSFSNEEMIDPKRFKPVEMLPLSKKKREALREIIKKMKSEQGAYTGSTALFDEEYLKFISNIAGPETETGAQGTATMKFTRNEDD